MSVVLILFSSAAFGANTTIRVPEPQCESSRSFYRVALTQSYVPATEPGVIQISPCSCKDSYCEWSVMSNFEKVSLGAARSLVSSVSNSCKNTSTGKKPKRYIASQDSESVGCGAAMVVLRSQISEFLNADLVCPSTGIMKVADPQPFGKTFCQCKGSLVHVLCRQCEMCDGGKCS